LEFEAKAEELQIAHAAANAAPTGGLLVCDHDLYIEEQSYIVAYGKGMHLTMILYSFTSRLVLFNSTQSA
jgi:hypothetical protein